MSYTQLPQEERYQMYLLKKAGKTQTEIAGLLGRAKATISRALRRNHGLKGYRPKQAHQLALGRRRAKTHPRISPENWRCVSALIRKAWSPEQVADRFEQEHGVSIRHERLYQYIYADKRAGGDLHSHLRCPKARRMRYGAYDRRGLIPNQVSSEARPAGVASRRRLGDGEGDTVIGQGHRGALVPLVERKSRHTGIQAVPRKTAEAVRAAVRPGLAPYRDEVHPITYDNGRECTDHEGMARDREARISFAHP